MLAAVLLAVSGCGGSADTPAAPTAAAAADSHAGHTAAGAGTGPVQSDGHTDHLHLDIPESGVGRLLDVDDGRGHLMREVDAAAAPTVALQATADPAGGWTVRTTTTGFRWAPDDVNTPADLGAGHAHLYTPAAKVARVYGEWTFLSASAAAAGDRLTAVLYADDHTAWAVAGKPVEASVVLPAVTS